MIRCTVSIPERNAYLYIRQSSPREVFENIEHKHQFNLHQRARSGQTVAIWTHNFVIGGIRGTGVAPGHRRIYRTALGGAHLIWGI